MPTSSPNSPSETPEPGVFAREIARPQTFETTQLIVAEYQSLRAEILKLIELQSQLVALTVIAFGTVLSVGFQTQSPVIILIHPLLAAILGTSWLNHAHAASRIATYLRLEIEERVGSPGLHWESYVQKYPLPNAWFGYWGVRSIFMCSSVLAIIASSVVGSLGPAEWAVYVVALAITLGMTGMFFCWREPASGVGARVSEK